MIDDEMLARLSSWVKASDRALYEFATATNEIPKNTVWSNEQSFAMGALLTACLRTSGSSLILVENGKIWDAEILMRSVLEGSIKAIFLLSNKGLFEERYKEFSDCLFDIEGIKQHRKAEILLKSLKNPLSEQWKPIREIMLPEEVFEEISRKYPSSLRRRLESKWGFTGLIEQLGKEDIPAASLFVMLLHGYSMASHHAHADYTGVASALERDYREEVRRSSVYMAHAARLISDIFWLSYARVHVGYNFFELNVDPLKRITNKYQSLNEELTRAIKEWGDIEYE